MEHPASKREGLRPAGYEIYPQAHGYPQYFPSVGEDEINLLDYWRVLWRRKIQICLVTLLCISVAIAASFLMPKKYKAQATLMPLTSSGSGGLSSLASQISSIPLVGGQLGGLAGMGGGKAKELVNILKSRTLSTRVVEKFDLMKVIFAKQYDSQTDTYRPNWLGIVPVLEDAVDAFTKKVVKVEEDKKTGLIKIELKMKDPVLAAKVANEMIFQLQKFIESNSLTLSKRNRIFIEEQLVKNGSKLLEAGKELNNFYAQNKISSVTPQLDVNVGSYESIPKPFEEFQENLNDLQRRQQEVQKKKEQAFVRGVPGQIYLQYLTLNRDLISRSHALLTQQYELAKIEESKEDLAFQVIDKAEIKVRHSSPKAFLILAVGTFGGFFLAVFIAFFREYIAKLRAKESAR